MMKTISILCVLALVQVESALGTASSVWRFWSPALSRHFYTISETERDYVLANYTTMWVYEGVGYNAYKGPDVAGLRPVYRFWSNPLSAHFYTLNEAEKDFVISEYAHVWTYEGIAFYAWPAGAQPAGTLPVYRFWSGLLETHFFTADNPEQFALVNDGAAVWDDEGIAWYAYPAESASPATIVKGPYLQWPTSDGITVMWETDAATTGRVDYGTSSLSEAFVETAEAATLHKVELTGLTPDTSYVYRVTSDDTVSSVGNFTTAPATNRSFRFAVYGDSRSYPDTHAEVIQSIIDSGPDIVLHTGDIISAGRNYALWSSEFFAPAQEMLLTTPILPVPGNHDYNGTGPLWFFYFFDQPYNTGWFAMTYGNTRFIGLDTDVSCAPGSPQYQWLLGELTSAAYTSATWHVAFFHHPPFTATFGHSDDIAVQSHLVPLFEAYGVDVAFQGHSHAYERYWHNGVYYIVTGGGGGPLYDLVPDIVTPIRQFGLSTYHHCVVDVDVAAQTLTVAAVDNSGQTFDTVQLLK
jgi:predicted phosphodiesterase